MDRGKFLQLGGMARIELYSSRWDELRMPSGSSNNYKRSWC
jgi:hypothetical protein